MDTSKIKNFIILILLTVNIFLLGLVASDKVQERSERRAEAESVAGILAEHGIRVESGVELDMEALSSVILLRNLEKEQKNVSKLLDGAARTDVGGNIYQYTGNGGQAVFRSTGEMDMLFGSGEIPISGSLAKTAAKTMKRLGLETSEELAAYPDGRSGGSVTLPCLRDGRQVYNASLTFSFSDDSLIMISGIRVFDEMKEAQTDEKVLSASSAIMRFLGIIRENGHVCRSITGFSAGYVMSVAVSGESTLTPIWHIGTDTGDYYINAITGEAENPVA